MRRATAVTLLALGLGACSLAISVDGLTGGGADAGIGAPDGSTSSDAGPVDAAAADRSSPDGGPFGDADTGPVSPCASTHAFCTDFEEPDPRAKWDDVSSLPHCAVRSGVLECTSVAGQTDPVIWRRGVSLPKGAGFRVDFDLAITAPTAQGFEIDPFTIDTSGGPSTSVFLALPVYGTQVIWEYNKKLPDGGTEYPGVALPVDRAGGWHHYTMTFQVANGATGATSSVAIDGALVGAHAIALPGAMPSTTIRVGLAYLSAAPVATFRMDNLVVDEL